MIDALPRSSRLRIVALTVFALIASVLGAVAMPATSARAEAAYGGVRIVDLAGDPVVDATVRLAPQYDEGDGWWPPVFSWTDDEGVAMFADAPELPVSVAVQYFPVGGPAAWYRWNDGDRLTTGDGDDLIVAFDSSSSVILDLVLDVDMPDGAISGQRLTSPVSTNVYSSIDLFDAEGEWLASTSTDENGNYAFRGIPSGTYKLHFRGNVTGESLAYDYLDSWYENSTTFASATPVVVADAPVTGVNQTLQASGTVRGLLGSEAADLEGPVVAFFPSSWIGTTPDWTSPEIRWAQPWDGVYTIDLPAGSYRAAFMDRVTTGSIGFEATYDYTVLEYWDGAATLETSKAFTLAAGETKTVSGLDVPTFKDVAPNSQFAYEIAWLALSGVTTGYDGGTFKPLATVNRDAMAAFLYRFAGKPTYNAPAVSPFVDVPTSNQFYKEITWLASTGITTGWDIGGGKKEFRPLQPVARDAMAAFLFRFAKSPSWWTAPETSPFSDIPKSHQFYKEITWLANEGISTGYDVAGGKKEYRPLGTVNRDAMAAFLYRFPSWLRWGWSDLD